MPDNADFTWLPGWGMDERAWGELPQRLAGATHRFAAFDGICDADQFAARAASELRSARTIAIGWSIGAMAAVQAVHRCAAAPAGLVLIGATARFASRDPLLGWSPRVLQRMKDRLIREPAAVMAEFLRLVHHGDNAAAAEDVCRVLDEGAAATFGRSRLDALVSGLDFLLAADLDQCLAELSLPVLWIHGRNDAVCPLGGFEANRAALRGLANYRFECIDGAGHAPFWGRPGQIATLIEGFADDLSG